MSEGRSIQFGRHCDLKALQFQRAAKGLFDQLPVEQSVEYFQCSNKENYLLQVSTPDGSPSMQAVVQVERPQWFSNFATASVFKMGHARDGIEEEMGIRILRTMCRNIPGVMSLRLQPHRLNPIDLMNFQARARRQGFSLVDPIGTTRTLIADLCESEEDLLSRLPSRTRSKVKHPSRVLVDLRIITDDQNIERCRLITAASFKRSGGTECSYPFEAAFRLARERPQQAHIIGCYLVSKPEELLAFVIGVRSGDLMEYTSGGSLQDPTLRMAPFNTFLIWELMNWGRLMGSKQIDLGGVTDGGALDPLSGVSQFKRSLCRKEVEVGREMFTVLRPKRFALYKMLKQLKKRNIYVEG